MHSLFLRGASTDWDVASDYTQHIATLHSFDRLASQKQTASFTGENGSGKSMPLEAITVAYGFSPKDDTKNYRFYTKDTYSSLHEGIRLSRGFRQPSCSYFLRAESFYNLVTKAEECASIYQGRELHSRSHGESFLSLIQGFRDIGLFLLGGPGAALSSRRQLTLLIQLSTMVQEGSQFLIVADFPILFGIPNVQILSFDDGIIEEIIYEQTASYQITGMFMDNREYMLDKLLQESEK